MWLARTQDKSFEINHFKVNLRPQVKLIHQLAYSKIFEIYIDSQNSWGRGRLLL